jgi:hypothetical protein
MSAQQFAASPSNAATPRETPMDIGPWGTAAEPMLPARQVVWASLALILVTLAVLILG